MAKNGDLKRFYPDNPQAGKDFARLDENGKIPSSNMPTGIVSVVANPTLAGTETELSGLQVGSTKYSVPKGTIVEGNPEIPEGTTPTDLSDIKIGDTYYSIPEGTEVVANPTLEGTEADLTGLQVGNTKYKVPSGGGGGASIGVGYTLSFGAGSFGEFAFTALILCSYNGVYGWHIFSYDAGGLTAAGNSVDGTTIPWENRNDRVFTNASIICFLAVDSSHDDSLSNYAFKLYDGTAVNDTNAINKLSFMTEDVEIYTVD